MFNQSSFPLSFTRKESGAKKAGPDKESGYSPFSSQNSPAYGGVEQLLAMKMDIFL